MSMRTATPEDAEAIAAIYAPIVAGTAISFELEPPSVAETRARIERTLERLPNEASVRLHEAAGFRRIGVFRNVGYKLRRWHDVGWWQKTLREPLGEPGAII